MKTKAHSNKLQKSSGLFLPLGLVLTLLTIFGLLEAKTTTQSNLSNEMHAEKIDPYDFAQQREIQIERPKTKTLQKSVEKRKVNPRDEFETIEDNSLKEEADLPFELPEDKNPTSNILETFVEIPTEDIVEDVRFELIEDAPIFPGCEKIKEKAKRKACFSKKLSKFIGKKFNTDLASSLGLSSGKQKIWIEFTITKTGIIEIDNVRAGHVRLEKEGKRVVNLLPKMIPGKQRERPVNVKYILPIIFYVE